MITVSIDPVTKQVAMFSLPRDTVDVPVPPGPARNASGAASTARRSTASSSTNRNRADLWPGTERTRAATTASRPILGELYGLDIKYFVEVDFDGFKKVVDALGGVTINVQIPVVDDRFPADDGAGARLYIPTGIQHMTGAQALRYARVAAQPRRLRSRPRASSASSSRCASRPTRRR